MDGPFVVEHLGAEKAAGVRVLRVAGHPDRPAVLHLDHQAAGVGAVVGADGALDFGGHGDLLGWLAGRVRAEIDYISILLFCSEFFEDKLL